MPKCRDFMEFFLDGRAFRRVGSLGLVVLGWAVLPGSGLFAAPSPAKTGSIAAARVTFAGSLRELPAVQKATLHAMSVAHLTDSVRFNVPLALRNQVELEARVNAGEVIPGEELRAKYFPLQSDLDAVAAWLKGEGFTVDSVAERSFAVFAHGTVAQVQTSFRMTVGLVTDKGADHIVAETAPSLPADLAGTALGVDGLTYRPRRNRLLPTPSGTALPAAVPSGGYHIKDIRTAYSGAALSVNGTTLDGTGQSIGIEAYLFPLATDLTAFWKANGITRTGTITDIDINNATLQTATGDPDDYGETALDAEWASGIAPGANIVVYATNETNTNNGDDDAERIYARALSDAMASGSTLHTFSSSYGPTEAELSSAELTAYNNYFLSMTAAGLTYINATGDIGSGSGSTATVEAYGNFPYTLGVGGTNLQVNTSTDARTSEVSWTGSSGGFSQKYTRPAWQVATGLTVSATATNYRAYPDIALAADNNNSPAYFYDNGSAGEVGGTSWSAPTFAGFFAMIQQGRSLNSPARGAVGFLNPRIYPLVGTNNFYDVTSGKNGLYTAGVGYDEVTGLGVPTVSNLLATLLGPTITSFTPAGGAAGTSVVITGTNFYVNAGYPATVTFNGVAAASVTVNSATQITAVAPAGVTTGSIVVTTFGDAGTSASNFTVNAPDLTVTSTHTGSFTQADAADTYTLTVTNGGTAATSGTVSVTDTLPNGLTATGLSGAGWTVASNSLSATRTDALATGASYPALTLTVSVSATAASSVNNSVTVSGGGETNTVNDSASDPTTVTALTPSQSWRYQYFGTTADSGNAADAANPAGDGINNLTKYALGLNPTMAEVSPVTEDTSTGYLRLTVPKNPNATDVTYNVQVNGDLTNPAGWTTNGTTVEQNTSNLLVVHDSTPVNGVARQFLRLQVSR